MGVLRNTVLVSTQWLKKIVQNPPYNHRILDASWHLPDPDPDTARYASKEYKESHIPGALFFDIDECSDQNSPFPHMLPKPKEFEEYVSKLGINNRTEVILYDNSPQFPIFSAQRVWWMFRVFGHKKVSILEGGFQSWKADGGPVTDKVIIPQEEIFKAEFNPKLIKLFEDIDSNIDKTSFCLLDARSEGRYKGSSPEPRKDLRPGSIPGSTNIPFAEIFDLDKCKVKPTDELKAVFDKHGVDLNKPLAASCGSGVSACTLAMAAYLCGKEDVAIYDGSWTEWFLRAPDSKKLNVPPPEPKDKQKRRR